MLRGMGCGYDRRCPVARAVEVLDERWTVLVVRELLAGGRHFNELRRGLPGVSPTVLSKRLHHLRRLGVVERRGEGPAVRYELTPAGEDLHGLVDALGAWGTRWAPGTGEGQPPVAGCCAGSSGS